MGRSLSPLLRRELANLDKDPDSRRSAMKALRSYALNLDSKSIPHFLAEVADPAPHRSSAAGVAASLSSNGECTISLFEVLARVHGRNIVPQIDNIMSTILRTLSSSGGSFPIHQACSKVVPAVARYAIEPATPDHEKSRIISSLCKPLSEALMASSMETSAAASGAALCLKALVESSNWRFAPEEMVNEACLKVAGALEEKATQTNAHMGLVMALAKHNGLIAEAYARSLVRSGLQILAACGVESNSQRRLSAVQMVNFLMRSVDPRSISSELFRIVDAMDKCQAEDKMPFVRGAASEALQTAKTLTGQKSRDPSPRPILSSNSGRKSEKSPMHCGGDKKMGAIGNGSSAAEFCSPESQTVDSCVKYEAFTDSPASVDQSCNPEYRSRASRRLWNNDGGIVDVSLKDGLFLKACSVNEDSNFNFEHDSIQKDQNDLSKANASAFSGFVFTGSTAISPQRSQFTIDDVKIYTTPRKLMRSLQSSTKNCESRSSPERLNGVNFTREISNEVDSSSTVTRSHYLNCKPAEKRNSGNIEGLQKRNLTSSPGDFMHNDTESVSSTEVAENITFDAQYQVEVEHKSETTVKSKTSIRSGAAGITFLCAVSFIILAIIFSLTLNYDDEFEFDMVPT